MEENNYFDKRLREMIHEVCNGKHEDSLESQYKNFNEFIKNNRINKSAFGEIVGVSGSTITKYLKEPQNLKISQVVKLAEATQTDVRILIDLIK